MGMLQHNQYPISVPGNEPGLELKSMDHYTGVYFLSFRVMSNTETLVLTGITFLALAMCWPPSLFALAF